MNETTMTTKDKDLSLAVAEHSLVILTYEETSSHSSIVGNYRSEKLEAQQSLIHVVIKTFEMSI